MHHKQMPKVWLYISEDCNTLLGYAKGYIEHLAKIKGCMKNHWYAMTSNEDGLQRQVKQKEQTIRMEKCLLFTAFGGVVLI